MPELPEVETIKRTISINRGARVERIEFLRQDILRQNDFEPERLQGRTIQSIERRGKFLIMAFPRRCYVIVHLGMSGRFYMLDEDMPAGQKHVHMVIHLDNGKKLIYQDPRRFGGVWLIIDRETFFCRLGLEPLEDDFTAEYLEKILPQHKTAVKNVLLDQRLISGIGNIYADEALFAAGIRPERPACSLTQEETVKLWRAVKQVLADGIEARGTTFRDYRDGLNQSGDFQHHLKVYGRTGQPCTCCGESISKGRVGGRGSHFCAKCQH